MGGPLTMPLLGFVLWRSRAWGYIIAGGWCVVVVRRLPKDLAELWSLFQRYRHRNDPDVLTTMDTEERRARYREECAREFWGTLAVHLCFFWPVTALVLVFLAWALYHEITGTSPI